MKIYCCQTDIVWENKQANFDKVSRMLKEARPSRGSLLLLPEMFAVGFSMNAAEISETPSGESEQFVASIAREYGINVLAGVVTAAPEARGRNQAVAFSPEGKLLGRYTKIQPFNLGGEGMHYEAGEEIITFPWQNFTVAPFICYDLRFPELFRGAVKRKAQLFAVIANWPVTRIHHWVTLLQARAIENQAFVAGVNRCGSDPKYKYNGRSVIIGPQGEILADAGNEEGIISADIDLKTLLNWRADFPALQDMRFR